MFTFTILANVTNYPTRSFPGSDIGSVFKRLCLAVNELDKQLGFQHDESRGYLSSCPTNLGTGMRASVHVKIPNASEHPDFKKICDEYHIQVSMQTQLSETPLNLSKSKFLSDEVPKNEREARERRPFFLLTLTHPKELKQLVKPDLKVNFCFKYILVFEHIHSRFLLSFPIFLQGILGGLAVSYVAVIAL